MEYNNEIIETDSDTKEEDFSETEGLYPYDPSVEDIDLKETLSLYSSIFGNTIRKADYRP